MHLSLYQVDAFSSSPFQGNPAAVCLLDSSVCSLDNATRQNISAEMNLSETAYVEGTDFATATRFKLRWFTPTQEARLCGHATLAAAAALVKGEGNKSPTLHFDTVWSGELTVSPLADGGFCMELPAYETGSDVPEGAGIDAALIQELVGDRTLVEEVRYCQALEYLLVVLDQHAGRAALEALRPEGARLKGAYTGGRISLVMATVAGAGKGLDFVSRCFAPWNGIDEDPVTGSAHAVMAPYWRTRLGTGERPLRARQCSPRGGELTIEVAGGRCRLVSDAVIVFKGELLL